MARILDHVSGHSEIVEKLLAAQERGHLPSTFLFTGPQGVGRRKVARGLVQALVCERQSRGCGECGPCLRVESGHSEALLCVEPEKTQIKIEQAREVQEFFTLRSISKVRAVIIDQAHQLNPQAANTLLKLLEEPPDSSYFFLIAPTTRHVLPTLRSRSQVIRFSPLSESELGQNSPAPTWALRSAMGSFERLEALIGRDEMQSRKLAWDILNAWLENREIYLDPESREWMRDRTTLLGLSRYWLLAFRDALFYQAGERQRLLNADHQKGLAALAELEPRLLSDVMKDTLDLENGLLAQRDPHLSFEEFWIKSRRRVPGALSART